MSIATRQSLQRYADIGLETEVLSASPSQLITLLMDAALSAMRRAKLFMQAGNIQARGAAISKAIEIVESGLKASVKPEHNQDDSLANHLIITYDAIVHHLLHANLKSSLERLGLAEQLLGNIASAWKEATSSVAG